MQSLDSRPVLKVVWNLLLISVGSLLCALAVNGILVPKNFIAGGFTGLALLLHYLLPAVPVGAIYFLLNIPLFVIGWMSVGRRFFIYSIVGMVIYSLAVLIPFGAIEIEDKILCALSAGLITGLGSGIILRSLGSAGGMDILSIILLKRFALRLGATSLAFNALLMLAALNRLPLNQILYTLIYIYVSAHVVNIVVTGLNQRKAVMIVSPRWQEIAKEIMEHMQRGVTLVEGRGGYSGKEQQIIYSVITFPEIARFKERVRRIDPDAFVVISETLEVMGRGIGNQPHW